MSDPASTGISGVRTDSGSLPRTLYRYFFYGWLFRPADSGSDLERAAALRHNRQSARWLPTYLRRWLVGGTVILLLQMAAEQAMVSAPLSAALAVAFVLVLVYLVVTGICWTILRLAPRR